MHFRQFLLTTLLTSSILQAKISTRKIEYKGENGTNMVGYLALPDPLPSKAPAVIVVHEWWGQTDYPIKRADMLADLGYIAFAIDMYGNRKISEHPKDAQSFSSAVMTDAEHVAKPFNAALNELKKVKEVDANKIAAIGYCFGGTVALEMAKQGADLQGIVLFHSGLKSPTKTMNIKGRVLVLNGADDSFIKSEDILVFKKDLEKNNVKYEYIALPNAKHGYSNPSATELGKANNMPNLAYSAAADKESWNKMQSFLKEIFK